MYPALSLVAAKHETFAQFMPLTALYFAE